MLPNQSVWPTYSRILSIFVISITEIIKQIREVVSSTISKYTVIKKEEKTIVGLESKKDGKDQQLIQSCTNPDQGYHMGK